MLAITLEEATLELLKPTEVADFYVQSNSAGVCSSSILYVVYIISYL